jgi:hypothetical protein
MLSLAALLLLTGVLARPQADTTLAQRAIREALSYSVRDGGALWGQPLTTPLLIVDPSTRRAVSDAPDAAGLMTRAGSLYEAQLPPDMALANTSVTWGGRTWAMVLSPLPADSMERGILLMHEVWHSVQAKAGIPLATPDNPHIETASGRTWLRVEARALAAALAANGPARREAMTDALAARMARRASAPGSDVTERQLELSEGLAEFTGIATVVRPEDQVRVASARLARLEGDGSMMRSFPYATGTAWALLLELTEPGWRAHLTAEADLAILAAAAMHLDPATLDRSDARFSSYGLAVIRATEEARQAARAARQDSLRARYVAGPTLRLPLAEMNMSFNPNAVEPLPGVGTVYRPFRLSDQWGVLDADSSGALVNVTFSEARVAAPDRGGVSGAGWRLTLNAGWEVVPADRAGDYTIRKR